MGIPPKDIGLSAASEESPARVDVEDGFSRRDQTADYGTEPLVEAPGPSPIAARVRMLKDSALAAGEKHSRLPQTLFWSLFHSEVNEIKRKKARKKLLEALK